MNEKPNVIYNLVKLLIYSSLAVVFFFCREYHIQTLKYFIGSLMLMYGVEALLCEILLNGKHFLHAGKTYLGFVEIIFGTVILIANVTYETVCVVWASWSILREAYEIKEIIVEYRTFVPRLLSGIESVIVIILSTMLIIEPGEHHAMFHLYLLLIELIFEPLTSLLDIVIHNRKEAKKAKKLQEE